MRSPCLAPQWASFAKAGSVVHQRGFPLLQRCHGRALEVPPRIACLSGPSFLSFSPSSPPSFLFSSCPFCFFSRSGVVPLASMLVKITISPYVPKSRTLRSSRPPPSAVVLAGQFGHDVQGAVSDVVCPLPHRSLLGEVLAVIRSRSGG